LLGAAVFLDRFAVADGAARGTITMPIAAAGADQPLTVSGSAISEGLLTRSTDGKSVVLAGYAATPGTGTTHGNGSVTGINDSATSGTGAVPRVVGRVDATGAVSTSVTTTTYSTQNVRGAATTDGSAYWMFGNGSGSSNGISYQAAAPGAGAFVSTSAPNVRAAGIFGGRLYGTTASGSIRGVFTMVSALPAAAEAATALPGFPTSGSPSPNGFVGLTLGGGTDADTLYVCDDSSSANGGGIQRWKLAAGTWSLAATFNDSMTSGCRGIAAQVSGGSIVLLVTTTETAANRLLAFTDTAAGVATATATVLATAPANTVFRGVALAPN
jgi:hypothetical protein